MRKEMKTSITLKQARQVMRKALKEQGLRKSYLSNIAMCIYDSRNNGRLNIHQCNEVAEKLISLLF